MRRGMGERRAGAAEWSRRKLGLHYPGDGAEEEKENDYDQEDRPAGHVCGWYRLLELLHSEGTREQ